MRYNATTVRDGVWAFRSAIPALLFAFLGTQAVPAGSATASPQSDAPQSQRASDDTADRATTHRSNLSPEARAAPSEAPHTPKQLGGPFAACCTCPGCTEVDQTTCSAINGVYQPGMTCAGANCPMSPPAGDQCNPLAPRVPEGPRPLDNRCSNTDGPPTLDCGGIPTAFGSDLWYNYAASCTGHLMVRTCGTTSFDTIVAVYGDNTPGCVCPVDSSMQLGCDDNGCLGVAGSELILPVVAGRCYTIRVGGVGGAQGIGTLDIECTGVVIHVDTLATGRDNGTNWGDAFHDLGRALDLAGVVADVPGMLHQVWIAGGPGRMYLPGDPGVGDRSASFPLISRVAIYGGFGGLEASLAQRNPSAFPTVLSGDIGVPGDANDNAYHVVTGFGADPTAILDGVVVVGGRATGAGPGESQGGGMEVGDGSPTVVNSMFVGNGASGGGAGIHDVSGNPSFVNCVIERNVASAPGGGVRTEGGSPIFRNCTIADNFALGNGGGVYTTGGHVTVLNGVLDGNGGGPNLQASQFAMSGGAVWTIGYSFIQGLTGSLGGVGNIGAPPSDPKFADPDGPDNVVGTADDDFGLLPTSPCIDAGDTTLAAQDDSDTDGDGVTGEAVPLDYAGEPRYMKDGRTVATGVPDPGRAPPLAPAMPPPIVDMGALEHKPDCNNNGLRDDLEVATGVAGDCNLNVVPDACEPLPDCNQNGLADTCDIRDGISPDCNYNGYPDECEIPLSPGQFYCGPGCTACPPVCDPDCNANGVPDACDIRNCTAASLGFPGCDDCNLNGVPDSCDIASGTSEDLFPADGVPDECVRWISALSGNWSVGGNWLRGIPPQPNEFATIDIDGTVIKVLLDVIAEVSGLRLGLLTTLNVTLGDLFVNGPRGIVNKGVLHVDDRMVAASRMVLRGGDVLVERGAEIDIIGGELLMEEGSHYEAVDPPDTAVASLHAGSVRMLPTYCGESAQLSLRDRMQAVVDGPFVMDGTGVDPCGFAAGSNGAVAGGKTPPILRLDPETVFVAAMRMMEPTVTVLLTVSGFLQLLHSAEVCIGCDLPGAPQTVGVALGGDFDNRSMFSSLYRWRHGGMVLNGGGIEQYFEVAGLDLGDSLEGFATTAPTLTETFTDPHENFSMKILDIAAGSHVTFRNLVANSAGTGPCQEALYVDYLIVRQNTQITLDNVRIYYISLIVDPGASFNPIRIGCGDAVRITGDCPIAPTPTPEMIDSNAGSGVTLVGLRMNRAIAFRMPAGPNGGEAIRVHLKTLPAPWNVWNGTLLWVTAPQGVCETSGVGPGGSCPAGAPRFLMAGLSCDPLEAHTADWSQLGTVYLVHPGFVPGGIYELQALDRLCDPSTDPPWFSAPLTVTNARWGDVAGPYDPSGPYYTAPDNTVSITADVTSALNKFGNRPGAPVKARVDVEPCITDLRINITDVTRILDAFRGLAFPYAPGGGTCPTSPCLAAE